MFPYFLTTVPNDFDLICQILIYRFLNIDLNIYSYECKNISNKTPNRQKNAYTQQKFSPDF